MNFSCASFSHRCSDKSADLVAKIRAFARVAAREESGAARLREHIAQSLDALSGAPGRMRANEKRGACGSALRGFVTSWGSYATIWAACINVATATGVNSATAKAKAANLENVFISFPRVSNFVDYEMPARARLDADAKRNSARNSVMRNQKHCVSRKGKAANL
jgi:hypothetical protein